MRLNYIFKILFGIAVLIGVTDFILYFTTFSKVYDNFGVYLVLTLIPLGLLFLIVNIVLWLRAKDNKTKKSCKRNTIMIFSGFILLLFLVLFYFQLNKYSRLTIQNRLNNDLTEIYISSIPNKTINKNINVIKPNRQRKFLLNKFKNHEWEICYTKEGVQIIDTIKYYRYFRHATNDKLIVTEDGLIDQMYETQIMKEN